MGMLEIIESENIPEIGREGIIGSRDGIGW